MEGHEMWETTLEQDSLARKVRKVNTGQSVFITIETSAYQTISEIL